uniref:Cellulase GH5 n=1 Tax=Flavobacterium sp. AUG42 TaxID=1809309 RepID=A0A4D6K9W0_9FLAO|nr:cellulase GH5 [Flavobacterium sp. AUG42]
MKKKYHLKKVINVCLFAGALILSSSVLKAQNYCSSTPVAVHGNLSVKGTKIVDKNNKPVSFAGNSYFWSNTGWGAEKYYNADVVKFLNDNWGTTIIRAAMGVEDSGGYISNPTENKNRVKTVVNAAIAEGMYVIIDWHSHHAEDNQAAAIAFFKEMAQTYGNNPNVIYEIYNEPLQVSWSNTIKPYAEAVISEIRKIDPDNLIIVGTPTWSQDVDVAANDPITSSTNIAYTLHFYAATHKESLRQKAQTALNKGIALMVTEWGTVEASGNGNVDVASTDAWMSFLATNDISHANWSITDKSEGASLVNPGASATGGWSASNLTASGAKVKSIIQNWKQYCTAGTTPTNAVPTVVLTSPLNNTSLVSGTAVQLKATASDSDGTVSQVEFFVNGTSIGKDTSSPYAINWTPTTGSYTLTAKATDNAGSSTTSTAIVVTANATGAANNIIIRAKGIVGDETMDIVVGGVVLGTFKLTTNYADYAVYGSGTVRAAFTNDQGTRDVQVDYAKIDGITYQAENQTINTGVWQNSTCGGSKSEWLNCSGYIEFATTVVTPINQAPTVSITSPINNSSVVTGSAIQINALASDSDGTISQVEFFVNGVSIGKDTSSPYTISWSPTAGAYSLTAKATDNAAVSKTSSVIAMTITAVSGGGATGNCTSLPTWTASAVFATAGMQVVYNGKIYKNNWYSSNQNPETNSGQWQAWSLVGSCSSTQKVATNAKIAINTEEDSGVKLFPNPSSDRVQLNTGDTDDFSKVSVFDAQGRLMFEKEIKSKEAVELSISNYLDGIYLVKLSGKRNATKILVKETK